MQTTPELKAIVQEIINRSGWASENSLAFIITGTGTRTAVAFETNPAASALLHIEYINPPTKRASLGAAFNLIKRELPATSGKLTCYPIPFSQRFNVVFEPAENESIGEMEILNSAGAVLKVMDASENTQSIDMAGYPAGIYFLGVQTNRTRYVKTLVKQ